MGVSGDDGAWERLRASRWDPPGATCQSEERRRTYVFALEQAEQMFRAAEGVGPGTRPLLVFYGLSQAGRAIAAAASSIRTGCGWQLEGHGIHTQKLRDPLAEIRVISDSAASKGSFVRLSELLGSPLWAKSVPVTLGSLWDLLPGNRIWPLRDEDESRRTPLWVEHRDLFSEPHPMVSVPVVYFPPWVVNSPQPHRSLAEYLASFPEARDFQSIVQVRGELSFQSHPDGWGELVMNWLLPGGRPGSLAERLDFVRAMTRPYAGSLYFFPAQGDADRSLHPLMAWWAVLHVLSMLARYQPAEWSAHISVDSSRHAVPLERLLREAIGIVPRLIAEAIDEVASAPSPA